MKRVKGQPITGAKPSVSHKQPFVPDAKETSANEETFIKQAPTPFKDNMTPAQMPAPSGFPGGSRPGNSGVKHSSPGARALPSGGAVGYNRMPNQTGQVNGRMGTSFPRKVGSFPSGFKSKRNRSFYGE